MEFSAVQKQLAIFQVINVKFFMKETRFVSNGSIFKVFGGHSANEPGLSPSTSLIVFTTSPKYFGGSQYHTTLVLRCLSVPHHPSTSVPLSTTPPQYFGVSQYHTTPVLRCLSVPHHPSTSVSLSTTKPHPSVFVCQYQITSASVRTHHQRSILTFSHL